MRKITLLGLAVLFVLVAAGCGTVKGFGDDISTGRSLVYARSGLGQRISDSSCVHCGNGSRERKEFSCPSYWGY